MDNVMVYLLNNMQFLNAPWFEWLYGIVVFLNPLALFPQLKSSITSKPGELQGVSVLMFSIFFMIQVLVALGAIKTASTTLFVSMTISAAESLLVIVIVTVRRRTIMKEV